MRKTSNLHLNKESTLVGSFFKNINYIRECRTGIEIITGDKCYIYEGSFISLLDKFNLNFLTTTNGRIEASKKVLNAKRYIPYFISDGTIFIKVGNFDSPGCILLNYCNIINFSLIDNENTLIDFASESLSINATKYFLSKQFKYCKLLIDSFDN